MIFVPRMANSVIHSAIERCDGDSNWCRLEGNDMAPNKSIGSPTRLTDPLWLDYWYIFGLIIAKETVKHHQFWCNTVWGFKKSGGGILNLAWRQSFGTTMRTRQVKPGEGIWCNWNYWGNFWVLGKWNFSLEGTKCLIQGTVDSWWKKSGANHLSLVVYRFDISQVRISFIRRKDFFFSSLKILKPSHFLG